MPHECPGTRAVNALWLWIPPGATTTARLGPLGNQAESALESDSQSQAHAQPVGRTEIRAIGRPPSDATHDRPCSSPRYLRAAASYSGPGHVVEHLDPGQTRISSALYATHARRPGGRQGRYPGRLTWCYACD